jgi:hypothetical protein
MVGDHNGFHTTYIEFCDCQRPGDYARWQQLIAVQLFPATFEQPQMAFTFTAMKQSTSTRWHPRNLPTTT